MLAWLTRRAVMLSILTVCGLGCSAEPVAKVRPGFDAPGTALDGGAKDGGGKPGTCSCEGKACGDDGCGGSCGDCPDGLACNDEGDCGCEPDCEGRASTMR